MVQGLIRPSEASAMSRQPNYPNEVLGVGVQLAQSAHASSVDQASISFGSVQSSNAHFVDRAYTLSSNAHFVDRAYTLSSNASLVDRASTIFGLAQSANALSLDRASPIAGLAHADNVPLLYRASTSDGSNQSAYAPRPVDATITSPYHTAPAVAFYSSFPTIINKDHFHQSQRQDYQPDPLGRIERCEMNKTSTNLGDYKTQRRRNEIIARSSTLLTRSLSRGAHRDRGLDSNERR